LIAYRSVYTGNWSQDLRHGKGELKILKPIPYVYKGFWKAGNRHGHGVMRFAQGGTFEGDFEGGRPLSGGTFKWDDGTQSPFVVDQRFQPYIGPGSDPAGWDTVLAKMMQYLKKTQCGGAVGGAHAGTDKNMLDDDDEESFGFGDVANSLHDSPIKAPPSDVESLLGPDEYWEEVEVDEHGNPIEDTARPVVM